MYGMTVDPKLEVAITVGRDKMTSTFNVAAGKIIESLKRDEDLGHLIKERWLPKEMGFETKNSFEVKKW